MGEQHRVVDRLVGGGVSCIRIEYNRCWDGMG